MSQELQPATVVMCFSGLDPTGGAGISADIETLASMGCLCAPIITCLTVQDSIGVKRLQPVDAELLKDQARAVLADMPVAAFKIGLLGSLEVVEAVAEILREHPGLPVVLDPVLSSGGGMPLVASPVLAAIREQLLPLTSLCTPNSPEARALASGQHNLSQCAGQILEQGCEAVLITGSHESTPVVHNLYFGDHSQPEVFSWERLPAIYHGSGCTLASACAGLMAQGIDSFTAATEAQEFTYESLKQGQPIGQGQWHPNRLYWARGEDQPQDD